MLTNGPNSGHEAARTCFWSICRLLRCGYLHQATNEAGARQRKRKQFVIILRNLRDSVQSGLQMTAQEADSFLSAAGQDVKLCGKDYGSGHSGIVQVGGRILGTVFDMCPSLDAELSSAVVTDDQVRAVYDAVCQYVTDDDIYRANRAMCRERAAVGQKLDGPRQTAIADGPHDGDVGFFWWKGSRIDVQPTPWHILKVVWDADSQHIAVQDLIDKVYFNEGSTSDIPDGRVKTGIKRANDALCGGRVPLTLRMKNGQVLLEGDV